MVIYVKLGVGLLGAWANVADIGLFLFVSAAVCFLHSYKTISLIEAARNDVSLKRPKRKLGYLRPCGSDQRGPGASALSVRQHVELVDPSLAKSDEADQPIAIECAEHAAVVKDPLAKEVAVFFGGVEAGKPREAVIKRGTMHLRNLVGVIGSQ